MSAPVPAGITSSFSPVTTGSVATSTFLVPGGSAVVTFQPLDVNNPGTATLYDSANNSILTISQEGYETFQVPAGGASYYFKATLGARLLAVTVSDTWRN